MKGLEQRRIQRWIGAKVNRVQDLVEWSQDGQKRSVSSSLWFQLIQVVECVRWISTTETDLGVFTTHTLSLLLLLLLSDSYHLFLHSFVPLRSLITENCSRASTVARLRSQNGLGQKWLLLCQESHSWVSFSWDPLSYLLTIIHRHVHIHTPAPRKPFAYLCRILGLDAVWK